MTQWLCKCPKCNKHSLMKTENTMTYFKCDYCNFDTRNNTENFKANSITIKLYTSDIAKYGETKGK